MLYQKAQPVHRGVLPGALLTACPKQRQRNVGKSSIPAAPTISRRGLISAAKLKVKPGNVPRSIAGLRLLFQYAACISPPKSVVPTIRPDSLIAFATRLPRSITIYLNCGDACGASHRRLHALPGRECYRKE